jgi:hypothetical protein
MKWVLKHKKSGLYFGYYLTENIDHAYVYSEVKPNTVEYDTVSLNNELRKLKLKKLKKINESNNLIRV